jgi:hypothetical protein
MLRARINYRTGCGASKRPRQLNFDARAERRLMVCQRILKIERATSLSSKLRSLGSW